MIICYDPGRTFGSTNYKESFSQWVIIETSKMANILFHGTQYIRSNLIQHELEIKLRRIPEEEDR